MFNNLIAHFYHTLVHGHHLKVTPAFEIRMDGILFPPILLLALNFKETPLNRTSENYDMCGVTLNIKTSSTNIFKDLAKYRQTGRELEPSNWYEWIDIFNTFHTKCHLPFDPTKKYHCGPLQYFHTSNFIIMYNNRITVHLILEMLTAYHLLEVRTSLLCIQKTIFPQKEYSAPICSIRNLKFHKLIRIFPRNAFQI